MKKLIFIVVILSFLIGLTGCLSEEEQAFQGTWYYMSDHLAPIVGESDLEVIWYFNEGYFEMQACCFNQDDYLTGYYRIITQDGDEMILELMDIKNHGAPVSGTSQMQIELLDDPDRLTINWAGPFERMASK